MSDRERELRDALAELEREQKGLGPDCPNPSDYPRDWFMWHQIRELREELAELEEIQNERENNEPKTSRKKHRQSEQSREDA